MARKLLHKLLIILFFIAPFLKVNAQYYVKTCDSILQLPIHDTDKANLLKFKAKDKFETDVNANIYYMEHALPIAEKYKKYKQVLFFYNNLGNSYLDKGDFANALKLNLKCLKLAEQQNSEKDIINSWMNLGNTYADKGEDNLGRDCYKRAIELIKLNNEKGLLADAYANIALLFDYTSEKDSALFYMKSAKLIYEMLKDSNGIALCSNNIGLVYMDHKDYKKAAEYLYKSKAIDLATENHYSLFLTMNNIGDLYAKMGNYKKSFAEYDSALTSFKDMGGQSLLIDAYRGLADASAKMGNYEQAHEYRTKYADLKDTVFSAENLSSFSEIKVGYEKEMNEKEISLLKAENVLKETRKKTYQILAIIALVLIIAVFWLFYYRFKIKKRSEAALKNKNKEIEEKNEEMEVLYTQVTDSIRYAKRIQEAILPSEKDFNDCFKDHFIYFKPKDIVSGDFYWLLSINENDRKKVVLATSDCTGHGVPGGFMSMLGSSLLTEIVNEKKVTEPADILDLLRIKIISALKQKGNAGENQDGMDISICKFDLQQKKLVFGSANNAVYLVRENKLTELKPDKQPIGISHGINDQFNQREVSLMEGDCIYTFTDGFADQFGGPKGKKFKYKQFEQMLLNNVHLSMEDQKIRIDECFENWKGDLEQIDDILIIGVRV